MFKQMVPLVLLFIPAALIGQSPKSAVGGYATLSAGGEFSTFNPDYTCSSSIPFDCSPQALGPTAFFNLNLRPRWGADGEARWLNWKQQEGQLESTYLAGPRFRLVRYDRVSAWAKILLGGGWITTAHYPQPGSLKGSYFVYAPGATLEYHLKSRLSLRADYEFQEWPSFVAGVPGHDHGLTPNGMSFGVAYNIRRAGGGW